MIIFLVKCSQTIIKKKKIGKSFIINVVNEINDSKKKFDQT